MGGGGGGGRGDRGGVNSVLLLIRHAGRSVFIYIDSRLYDME